jgi:hypothetical protein
VFEEVEKIFNSGKEVKAVYNKDGKDFFRIIKRTEKGFKDIITGETVLIENFYKLSFNNITKDFIKYLKLLYRSTKDLSIFEDSEFLETSILSGTLDVLRFFKLRHTDYTNPDKNTLLGIANKIRKYLKRYTDDFKADEYYNVLKDVEKISVLISFWPLEIKKMPVYLKNYITPVRFIENIYYYNILKIPEVLYADFSMPGMPYMEKVRNKLKEFILLRSEEAKRLLKEEKIEAKKQNDLDSIFEIDIVLDIIKKEEDTLHLNLNNKQSINDALTFWPEILLPAPNFIKLF